MQSRCKVPTSLRRRRFCAHLFARGGERHHAGDRPSFASTGMADNLYGRADPAPTKELSGTVCRRAGWRAIARRSRSVAGPPCAPSPGSPHTTIAGATVRVGAAPVKGEPRSEERAIEERATEGESIEAKPLPEERAMEGKSNEAKPLPEERAMEGKSIEAKPLPEERAMEGKSIEAKSIPEERAMEGESIAAKPLPEERAMEGKSIEAKSIAVEREGAGSHEAAGATKGVPSKAATAKGWSTKGG